MGAVMGLGTRGKMLVGLVLGHLGSNYKDIELKANGVYTIAVPSPPPLYTTLFHRHCLPPLPTLGAWQPCPVSYPPLGGGGG